MTRASDLAVAAAYQSDQHAHPTPHAIELTRALTCVKQPVNICSTPPPAAGSEADPLEEGYQSDESEQAEASCCGFCAPAPKVEFSHTSMSIKHQYVPVMYIFNQRTDTHVSGQRAGRSSSVKLTGPV